MKRFDEMTKIELIEMLEKKGNARGESVLKLLKSGYDTIEAIGEELNITSKNVSSIFSGLRKKGYAIISVRAGGQSIVRLIESDEEKEKFGFEIKKVE